MKKKFALLLAFTLTASLVPAMAVSASGSTDCGTVIRLPAVTPAALTITSRARASQPSRLLSRTENAPSWVENTSVRAAGSSVDVRREGYSAYVDLTVANAREIISGTEGDTVVFALANLDVVRNATLPRGAMSLLADAGLAVEVQLPEGSVTLSPEVVASILVQGPNDITVSVTAVHRGLLNGRQRNATRYDDTFVSVDVRNGLRPVALLGANVTVTLPVDGPVSAWSMDEIGTFTALPGTAGTQGVTFTTAQMDSVIVIRSTAPTPIRW